MSTHLPVDPTDVNVPMYRRRDRWASPLGQSDDSRTRLVPASPWLTTLAFGVVCLPFVVAVFALIFPPGSHLTLADDLALIDLHTRKALVWKQQLGVFHSKSDWDHPGPTYFYLLSVVYRVFGNGARSMFIGATLLNGLSAAGCVALIRYRSTPARALWGAVWICGLIAVLAASGQGATTYSESVLGGLVSPWNPMVVIFPLLLTVLLCAAAIDRSGLSLFAAVITGSFVVQTNISALPVVGVVGGFAFLVWIITSIVDLGGLGLGKGASSRRRTWLDRRHWVAGPILTIGSIAVLMAMWLAPVIQQESNHPGNMTLIVRYFRSQHGTYPLVDGWRSLLSVNEVLVKGAGEVMGSNLGLVVQRPLIAWIVTILAGTAAVAAVAIGIFQRNRFAIGIGLLSLVGSAATVVSATHVVGYIFGYLMIWAVVLPVAAFVAPGMLAVRGRPHRHAILARHEATASSDFRLALIGIAVVVCIVAVVSVVRIPPLSAASDPTVGRLAEMVTPTLQPGQQVFVGDEGAGTIKTQLLDTEEFIGLVNLLDEAGYRPTVNHVWRSQFGPGYETTGSEPRQIQLSTWHPDSPLSIGYLGRAGDMAVVVTDRSGAAITRKS